MGRLGSPLMVGNWPAGKRMPSSPSMPQRTDTYYAWGVCALLLLAIGLIYGQTLWHGFLDYDDNGFVYESPHVTAGLTVEGVQWAFAVGPFGEWYPLGPAVPHARLPAFRIECLGASPDQRAAARRHVDRLVSRFVADDRRTLAERFRGHDFCRSSAARRIGGLGGRTPRRAERIVLRAHARGLSRLRASRPIARALPARRRPFCARH